MLCNATLLQTKLNRRSIKWQTLFSMLLILEILGCLNVSNKRAKGFTLRWNKWIVWNCRQVACFYFRHTTAIWDLYASHINQLDRMLHTDSKVHGANMTGPRCAPYWPYEPCYLGILCNQMQNKSVLRWQVGSCCDYVTACYVGNCLSSSEHWMFFNETIVCIEHLFG